MPEKPYNTTWYQKGEEPEIGMPCPKCNNGDIDESQYGGYWCRNCKWKWKLSKFPPKTAGETPGTDRIKDELDQGEEILREIKTIKDRMDALAIYLREKL